MILTRSMTHGCSLTNHSLRSYPHQLLSTDYSVALWRHNTKCHSTDAFSAFRQITYLSCLPLQSYKREQRLSERISVSTGEKRKPEGRKGRDNKLKPKLENKNIAHPDHLGILIPRLMGDHLYGDDVPRLDVGHRILEEVVEAPASRKGSLRSYTGALFKGQLYS